MGCRLQWRTRPLAIPGPLGAACWHNTRHTLLICKQTPLPSAATTPPRSNAPAPRQEAEPHHSPAGSPRPTPSALRTPAHLHKLKVVLARPLRPRRRRRGRPPGDDAVVHALAQHQVPQPAHAVHVVPMHPLRGRGSRQGALGRRAADTRGEGAGMRGPHGSCTNTQASQPAHTWSLLKGCQRAGRYRLAPARVDIATLAAGARSTSLPCLSMPGSGVAAAQAGRRQAAAHLRGKLRHGDVARGEGAPAIGLPGRALLHQRPVALQRPARKRRPAPQLGPDQSGGCDASMRLPNSRPPPAPPRTEGGQRSSR